LDKLYYTTYNLIEKYCSQKKFIDVIVRDPLYFDIEAFKEIPSLIKNYKITNIDKLILNFESAMKLFADEVEDTDIPDEFLDPILLTLMENPIYLPNSDIIIDKDTILKHLLQSETNPFTREHLTIDMIEEYNSIPEIKLSIDTLKEQITKYKN
jgi:ubiquitin conjugation factor E4 B